MSAAVPQVSTGTAAAQVLADEMANWKYPKQPKGADDCLHQCAFSEFERDLLVRVIRGAAQGSRTYGADHPPSAHHPVGETAPAQPTPGGDKGGAVAWQKRPAFGDYRVWTPCGMEAHDHEFWIDQNYEVRALYAAPQPASNAYALPDHIEVTPSGKIDWKMEVDRLNRLLVRAEEALQPFAEVYSGGEGFEGYNEGEPAHLTCGRVKHYGLSLGDFERAAVVVSSTHHSPPDLKAAQNTAESDLSVRPDFSGGETHD